MIASFFDAVGEALSERASERLTGPAFLFWTGGLALAVVRWGWEPLWKWLSALDLPLQAGLLVAALLLLVGSDALLDRFSFPLLRWMEGYWPGPPLGWLRTLLTRRQAKRQDRLLREWQPLHHKKEQGRLSMSERHRLARLDRQAIAMPPPDDLMPTAFGNVLRAAERRVANKYGLDPVVCWPRLWLLLPDDSRKVLGSTGRHLERAAQGVGWGVLFLAWGWISPWAIPVALVWVAVAWRLSLQAAGDFAVLVEAAFDVHRWLLYDATGWPRPADSEQEKEAGKLLSEFLYRGTMQLERVTYRHGG